jgi:putative nucleotidyltransferase with HDIG domain
VRGMSKIISLPTSGFVEWDADLLKVIDSPEFQRLRFIRQLGVVHWVFPSACHTRFEHSLGVAALAERLATSLGCDVLTLKLAALCHDLGHGPLSHGYDIFLDEAGHDFGPHEKRSTWILRRIVARRDITIDQQRVDDACELIFPERHDLPKFWYQIIGSKDGLDVDKLDYVVRDAYHLGLASGVDAARILQYVRVYNDELCFHEKLVHDINRVFTARHELHLQVYQHPTVRAIERMHIDALHEMGAPPTTLDAFLELDDGIFSRGDNALTRRVQERNLYRMVLDIPTSQPQVIARKLMRAATGPLSNIFYTDIVRVGYVTHPLHHICLYNAKGGPFTTSSHHTSAIIPEHLQDARVRVYVRDVRWVDKVREAIKKQGSIAAMLDDSDRR